ncbi:MAG: 30S ribosome-binding factor RbfA [Dethiobacter sp.]|jgi:ribosome-binding factor A|nr:30S ribosome-binding factor RbfA [Dethiobacter sp.]MBS3897934.1 30S ribosome-binding factor RbfA [Dethiobacter sp.]MBS3983682.1 30S ribosome-binding factor RbfA [Dethiobacter sp.]MCL4462965.1 30S ribosome-binding factor RbfA [Bacillota bacterium]MCL5993200.1 30S ribosome-binding factor RbfA [Bacillota bacterium]
MTEQRAQRVAEEMKREISDILRNELKDPRTGGIISVTNVDLTRDLRHAKVFISIFGSDQEQQETLSVLSKAVGFIRTEVGRRIRLRHTPQISFLLDKSIAYGAHINRVLRELNPPGGGEPSE